MKKRNSADFHQQLFSSKIKMIKENSTPKIILHFRKTDLKGNILGVKYVFKFSF